jgi:hypothetical protein
MQFDFHPTDFREAQLAICESKAGVWKGERIITRARFETGEACLAAALFDATKERLKSFIKASQYILQDLTVNVV